MFDIGWSEFLVIGIVALVVIGPKELPRVLRTVGQSVAKLRRMAGEFQGQFQEALREAELSDFKDQVTGLKDQVSGFADTARESISGSLPTNPLLDIENEVKAAKASVQETISGKPADATPAEPLPITGPDSVILPDHPAAAPTTAVISTPIEPPAFEDASFPPPPEPIEISPRSIEQQVAASLAVPAVEAEAPAKPKRRAKATPADVAPAEPVSPAPVEPELRAAVADLDAPSAPATPPKPRRRPKAELPEPLGAPEPPEVSAVVADLDGPPAAAEASLPKAKRRRTTKAAPGGDEGPAA